MSAGNRSMWRVVIFGNSGSGKSTLAKRIQKDEGLAYLDLDNLAWKDVPEPVRRPIEESAEQINGFMRSNDSWVIEGCYSDLLELSIGAATEVIFLNLPVEECIVNAKNRPWEPHKYESKQAQDQNLEMLIDWISQYPIRADTFSKTSHEKLFHEFSGKKVMYTRNRQSSQ